jgi:hypothetical protein
MARLFVATISWVVAKEIFIKTNINLVRSEEIVEWALFRTTISTSGAIIIQSPDGTSIAESLPLGTNGVTVFNNDGRAIGEWLIMMEELLVNGPCCQ